MKSLLRITDTIVAPATPEGRSALAVVRLSGDRAVSILAKMVVRSTESHFEHRRASHLTIVDPASGGAVDDCIATVFRTPESYTGEDVVELSVHGNPLIVEEIIRIACALGARIAAPGEFTRRAFAFGKLDLIRAEAIADLIEADTLKGLALARAQADGALSGIIEGLRESLLELSADVEYTLDFDEEELSAKTREGMVAKLDAILARVERIAATYRQGRMIKDGIAIAVVGRPNVGKSTIFNRLCGRERAIVSEQPGTTRDYIEHVAVIDGYKIVFVDTAGIRETEDAVERIGIGYALDRIASVEICLVVVDATLGMTDEDRAIVERLGEVPRLVVANKADLRSNLQSDPSIDLVISAKTGAGFDALTERIVGETIGRSAAISEETIDNARHFDIFRQIDEHLSAARGQLASLDFLDKAAFELGAVNRLFGELTGEVAVDEIVERIFSTFCVGK